MLLLLFLMLLSGCFVLFALTTDINADTGDDGFRVGETYQGFKLEKRKYIKEMNAEGLLFVHGKTGARLMKIPADDDNKTFIISFKTPPENDSGIPHILEHSVLNGSKKFPAKRPFATLKKGSLHTFLNAFTAKDCTMYPIAGKNTTDYFNLMNIYLDAVLFPMLYKEENIFKQEGWHYELDDKGDPVIYKGVVYNEMKGAFSAPGEQLSYHLYRNLFPDNAYGYASGGYPEAIPQLTYEAFKSYHKRYYHPSNSYIYMYGTADLLRELEVVDHYLAQFDKIEVDSDIPLQESFDKMREVCAEYAVPADSETDENTYLSLAFVAGGGTDKALTMSLDALGRLLISLPSAPLRRALVEAKIGKDIYGGNTRYKQNVFRINVPNAEARQKDDFKKIVMDTLKKVVKEGLDKKMVEGVINRLEFRLREDEIGSYPKAFLDNYNALNSWMFDGDPFPALEFEKPLEELKTALTTDYLEKIIQKYLLDNPHSLLVTLEPKKGLREQKDKAVALHLENFKASLAPDGIEQIVRDTKTLKEYQEEPDTPEALDTIPLLSLEDINPKAERLEVVEKEEAGVNVVWYPVFTNHVIYQRLYFDASVVPMELLPYASLLADVLGEMNTENYSYGDMDTRLNIHTGGFSSYLTVFREHADVRNIKPKFVLNVKSMAPEYHNLVQLEAELIKNSIYSDKERLKELITKLNSRMEAYVKSNGYDVAYDRMLSYLSPYGKYNEITGGLEFYRFISRIAGDFDKQADQVILNLKKVASLVFNKKNLTVGLVCSEDDYAVFREHLPSLSPFLGTREKEPREYAFDFGNCNEGLPAASEVQYVIKGFNFKDLGYTYSGKMAVLRQVLSREYLFNALRVVGGAYGGFAGISRDGTLTFNSYRDPNLMETYENFHKAASFLEDFEADEREMTRYIIGTIAALDRVALVPYQKGVLAMRRYFEKTTHDIVQRERTEILSTTAEDIRGFRKMIADVMQKGLHCTYGNEKTLEDNKELFNELIKVID
ncbi:MAG: peptidase [bacterium]|nr:peptidase [bacterium]